MGASFQLEFYSWEEIMIAKITLVSMLAAVALARPEAKAEAEADPFFYHHGVVGHVAPTCEHGADTLEVQTCAPRADEACTTADVVSEEITYEKRCKEVVLKTSTILAMQLLMLLLFPKSKPRPLKLLAPNTP